VTERGLFQLQWGLVGGLDEDVHLFRLLTSTRSDCWRPPIPGDDVRGVNSVDECVGPVEVLESAWPSPPCKGERGMPQERLPMRKIREVLRLKAQGLSKRQLAASLGISATAVVGVCSEHAAPA
jgi:hypothetical protein